MGISSGDAVGLNGVFTVLVGGFTALWLPAHRFERLGYPTTILMLHVIYLGFMGIVAISGVFGDESGQFTVFTSMIILPILWGLAVAGWRCRHSIGAMKFFGWSVGSISVFMLCTVSITILVLSRIMGDQHEGMVGYVLMFVSICTVIIAVGLGLFLPIFFKTHFWKRRFEAVFRMTLR